MVLWIVPMFHRFYTFFFILFSHTTDIFVVHCQCWGGAPRLHLLQCQRVVVHLCTRRPRACLIRVNLFTPRLHPILWCTVKSKTKPFNSASSNLSCSQPNDRLNSPHYANPNIMVMIIIVNTTCIFTDSNDMCSPRYCLSLIFTAKWIIILFWAEDDVAMEKLRVYFEVIFVCFSVWWASDG